MVLLVGLENIVLELRQQPADLGIHDFVFQVGVDSQRLDDLRDDAALSLGSAFASLLELTEQALDLLVIVLEQNDGVGRHTG